MGSAKDIMISNTDHRFLDMPISESAALIAASKFWIGLDTFLHHFATFVCKRGILLTPAHNELAEHKINYNIKMWPGKDWYHERYWKDYQQYLRKPSMELLHPQHVKNVIDEIVENYNKKFKTI
jgi:ADP-heptose:LPS heptosyltransferase